QGAQPRAVGALLPALAAGAVALACAGGVVREAEARPQCHGRARLAVLPRRAALLGGAPRCLAQCFSHRGAPGAVSPVRVSRTRGRPSRPTGPVRRSTPWRLPAPPDPS